MLPFFTFTIHPQLTNFAKTLDKTLYFLAQKHLERKQKKKWIQLLKQNAKDIHFTDAQKADIVQFYSKNQSEKYLDSIIRSYKNRLFKEKNNTS